MTCNYLQDMGFDKNGRGGRDDQILDIYFNEHFPNAVRGNCFEAGVNTAVKYGKD
jgi:hypothetical protein